MISNSFPGQTNIYPCFTLTGILGCTSCRGNCCPHNRHNHSFSHDGNWTKPTKTNILKYVWQVSALAGLKLLGVSAGLLLARGASSRSRATRRGRRSPKEVSHSHKQNTTLVFKSLLALTGVPYAVMQCYAYCIVYWNRREFRRVSLV